MIIIVMAGISDGGRDQPVNTPSPGVSLLASSMCAMDVFLGVEKMGGFHTMLCQGEDMRPNPGTTQNN